MRRLAVALAFFAASFIALSFLALPLVALLTHRSPATLLGQLDNSVVADALLVSAKTSVVAQALIILFGTPAAYLLATRRFPGRTALIPLVQLPIVLRAARAWSGSVGPPGALP